MFKNGPFYIVLLEVNDEMKISEINISLPFISACLVFFAVCGLMAIITKQVILWTNLLIFGIIGFIVIDLFQIIFFKEIRKRDIKRIVRYVVT